MTPPIKTFAILIAILFTTNAIAQQGMGVGTNNPLEMLHVSGAIKVGTDINNSNAAPSGGAGTIRFKAGQFEGWDGASWIPLGGGTGSDDQNLTGATLTGTTLQISIEDGSSTSVNLSALVNDADADATNEIQTLSLSGNTLAISSGNNVSLAGFANTDNQNLSSTVSGTNRTINISGGTGTIISVADNDNDATNEYNTGVALSGTQLQITDGGGTQSVDLAGLVNDGDWTTAGNDIYNANSGNVGVGTTAPMQKMHLKVTENTGQVFPLLIQNTGAVNAGGTGSGIGFSNMSNTAVKTAIYNERTSNYSLGKLHFLLSNTSNTDPVELSTDARMTITSAGKVGIGTTTPNFKLHVGSGAGDGIMIGPYNDQLGYNGTGTAPELAIRFAGYRDVINNFTGAKIAAVRTDICCSGLSQGTELAFFTQESQATAPGDANLTERLRIGNGGNVGIGTSSPSDKLHVTGSIRMVDGNQAAGYIPVSDANGKMTWTDPTTIATADDGDWTVSGSNVYRNTGNVGIGSTNPSAKLEVVASPAGIGTLISQFGSTNNSERIRFYDENIGSSLGPIMNFNAGNVAQITGGGNIALMPTGHVGIGTTSPTSALHISGTQSAITLTNTTSSATVVMLPAGTNYTGGLGTTTAHDFPIFAGNVDRLTVMSTGSALSSRVGIGTSTASMIPGSNAGLEIAGNVPRLVLNDLTGGQQDDVSFINTGAVLQIDNATTNVNIMTLGLSSYSGNVGIGTITPGDELHVVGNIRMVDGNQAAGKVMVSDANGTATWTTLGPSQTNAWSITGNSGTDPSVNFIGTTDNVDLVFRQDNTEAGRITTDVRRNTQIGKGANIGGSYNSGFGWHVFGSNLGDSNSAFGYNIMTGATGVNNTAIGFQAMTYATSASQNVAIGAQALRGTTTGQTNVALGRNAGLSNTTGSGNLFLGNRAGETAVGSNRLYIDNSNTTAPLIYGEFDNNVVGINGNLGVGTQAPAQKLHVAGSIQMVDGNQAVGYIPVSDANGKMIWTIPSSVASGQLRDADNDTKIQVEESADEDIIRFDLAGTEHFTMDGPHLGVFNSGRSVFLGQSAGANDDLTDNSNTYVGYESGMTSTTGYNNTAIGNGAFTSGNGYDNAALGLFALHDNVSGVRNTVLGARAGRSILGHENTIIGSFAGRNATGSGNIYLGQMAGQDATGDNKLYIENTSSNSPLIYGEFNNDIVGINGKLGIATMAPSTDIALGGNAARTFAMERTTGTDGFDLTIQAGGAKAGTADNDGGALILSSGIATGNGSVVANSNIIFKTATQLGSSSSIDVAPDEKMRITANGRVGIGSTNPNAKLEVVTSPAGIGTLITQFGSTSVAGRIRFYDENSGSSLGPIMNFNAGNVAQITGGGSIALIPNGSVGIGTATPTEAKLVVNGTHNGSNNSYGYLNPSGNVGTGSGFISYSIWATGRIRASEFNAMSDARAKTVEQRTNKSEMLDLVNKLTVTEYSYVDTLAHGNRTKQGFIAQEIEAVYPNAINKSTDFIPNVFEKAEVTTYDATTQTAIIRLSKPHGLTTADHIKLITEEGEVIVDVAEATETTITLKLEKEATQVFVYGKQVDDFRAVDYDQVFSIGIAAIQELSAKVEALESENAALKAELRTEKATNEARLQVIEEQLGIGLKAQR